MPKVDLFFETFVDEEIDEVVKNYKIVRLRGIVQFRTSSGFTQPYSAIIDSGAHTSLIPFSVWNEFSVKKFGNHKVFGLAKNKNCGIDVSIGEVSCVLVDEKGNISKELTFFAFLAQTDKVPLILGFKGVLEQLKCVFDYRNGVAYLE